MLEEQRPLKNEKEHHYGEGEYELSQQDVDSYVQLPHFVEEYEHKKTDEWSHDGT